MILYIINSDKKSINEILQKLKINFVQTSSKYIIYQPFIENNKIEIKYPL